MAVNRLRTRRVKPHLLRARTVQKSTHEVAVHWWRYRRHFLEAKLAQLEERQHTAASPAGPASTPRSAVLLHAVPADDRVVFEQHVERHVQAALAAADGQADPDIVEAAALHELIAEAEGRTPDRAGWGLVPEAGGLHYDVQPLPTADPRTIAQPTARRLSRRQWVLIAIVLVAGGLNTVVWARQLLAAPPATRPPPAATAAHAGATSAAATPTPLGAILDGPLDALRPTSLELRRDEAFVLPIDAVPGTLGGAWTPPLEPGRAAWLEGSIVNLVLCLAPADAALVTEARANDGITLRIANGETRQYVAAAPKVVGRHQREVLDQRQTGLTLIACGASGNDRAILTARLRPPSGVGVATATEDGPSRPATDEALPAQP